MIHCQIRLVYNKLGKIAYFRFNWQQTEAQTTKVTNFIRLACMVNVSNQSREEGKDQELIQSSTTPDIACCMGK